MNDQKRVVSIVNEKNVIPNKYISNVNNPQKNRQQNDGNYYVVAPAQNNGPIVATAAESSLMAAGGIVGIRKSRDKSKILAPDDTSIPPHNTKMSHDVFDSAGNISKAVTKTNPYTSTDDYLINSRQQQPLAKPSSLVSATMKISSATTEIYNKKGNESNTDGQGGNVLINRGGIMESGNYNLADRSINLNLQEQVTFFSCFVSSYILWNYIMMHYWGY